MTKYWSDLRGWAFAALGWSPKQFANATLRELHDGVTTYRKLNGIEERRPAMTRRELDELKALYPD